MSTHTETERRDCDEGCQGDSGCNKSFNKKTKTMIDRTADEGRESTAAAGAHISNSLPYHAGAAGAAGKGADDIGDAESAAFAVFV